MIFFKDEGPYVEDYDKTRDELISLGWIQKIYNIELKRAVYDITGLGYQYYFAICMSVDHTHLFGGPTLTEGQITAYIDDTIDLVEEGFIIDGIDSKKLTPKAAEYLFVLTDAHGNDATPTIKLNKNSNKKQIGGKKTDWGTKLGIGFAQFMKGMQSMSKAAQQYDKSSTKATRNAWGTNKKNSSREKTSVIKRKARDNKRKSKSKKKRKKHTDTTKSEILGGFDFKGIGDKMMKT